MLIKDMTIEQLKTVFENNSTARDFSFNEAMDSAHFWCTEYLEAWDNRAIDYCIGYDRGAYFRIENRYGFLDGLDKAQNAYGFLSDKEYTEANTKELRKKLDKLNYDDMTDEEYEKLDEELDEIFDDLEHTVFKRFMSEYESAFEEETQLDFWWTHAEEKYGDYDVDIDNDDYTIRKDICYEEELT